MKKQKINYKPLKLHTLAKLRKEGNKMSEVKVNNGNIEDALKRLKRKKKSEAARKRKF